LTALAIGRAAVAPPVYPPGNRLKLRFGVTKIFDRNPPCAFAILKNTMVSTYDIMGRYFFTYASLKFQRQLRRRRR
jgi:hypothetical protein